MEQTDFQLRMQEQITKETLDCAFDSRFPFDMKEKLQGAKVAIAGLGGLGSNIACMLARSGIGELLLVDFDVVDVTNLNRQMYFIEQIGKPKTEAIKEILWRINPYLVYKSVPCRVTPDNVRSLFEDYPICCEAFDRPEEKAMLVRELLLQCRNTTVISGNGMAGYSDVNLIQTRKMAGRLYVCGDESTDIGEGIGLIAPRVTVCAAHQANKVLQIILDK